MVVRFDWRQNLPDIIAPAQPADHPWPISHNDDSHMGEIFISGITGLFLCWIGYHWWVRPEWLFALPPFLAELISLVETAASFTLLFLWVALWWKNQRAARYLAPPLDIAQLQSLSPEQFEQYVAGLFRRKGYQVVRRGRSGDQGVDLEITTGRGTRAIVQCKRYQNNVGPDAVRELYGTLIHERANHAFLVTTANISTAARAWSQGKAITLIDGPTLTKIAAALSRGAREQGSGGD